MQRGLALFSVLVGLLSFAATIEAGPLHDAVKTGDRAAVERSLAQGAKVGERDGEGKTALYHAAEANHVAIIKLLISRGADPNQVIVGPEGPSRAPIHIAAKKGNLGAIRALAAAGADLTIAAVSGAPLHEALRSKQDKAAALLRSLGAANFKAPSIKHMIAGADVALGEKLAKGCRPCHALQKGEKPSGGYGSVHGPNLWNVVGRAKAGVPRWKYSAAMRKLKGVWTYDDLNSFIANPTAYVPGTTTWYNIKKQKSRVAIIAYLRTLSDRPAPLP